MRKVVLIVSAVLALVGVMSGTAMAVEPLGFNPETGGFTGEGGAAKLTGPLTISCTAFSVLSGVILNKTHVDFTVHFTGCTVLGIPVNTSGDAKGVILLPLLGLLCYLPKSTKAALKVGLYTEIIETVKIEGAGAKSEVKGTVIGEVTPLNKKQKTGETIYKKTNPTECTTENEGKGTVKKAELLANFNGGAFSKGEEEATGKLTFEKETEVKA